MFDDKKREDLNKMAEEEDDDDGWGDSGDWGDSKKVPEAITMSKNEMKNKNLNQLSDAELAAHKKGMDKEFEKNQLKPGDAGFVYDKVVDFSKMNDDGDDLEDDSWGEDDGVAE